MPLFVTLALGGLPLTLDLATKLLKWEFGSDLLAGMSIVASVLLGQYLVGAIVVMMLSGGTALERFAARCSQDRASGHRQAGGGACEDPFHRRRH